jgi:hypothetical protein
VFRAGGRLRRELAPALHRYATRRLGDELADDVVGRQGLGIAYDLDAQRDAEGRLVSRSYLVLDPTTFELLGRRVENLQDDVLGGEVPAGKGTYYATAELASGVVDRPGLTP